MARRSIRQRLIGRIERRRVIREHERTDRELLQTFAGEILTDEGWAAAVERILQTGTQLVLPEPPAARLDHWTRTHPGWKDRAVREAEGALRGELSLFGKTYPIRGPGDWHRDPDGLRQWPQVPHMRIRLDDANRAGDVRMQWEPARFHHALRLGRAFLATGRNDYAAAFLQQVDRFEKGNRPFDSIHWAVGMEVAIRAVNWLLAIEFMRSSDLFTEERCRWLVRLLILHGLFLENHIEVHAAGPTNHTLADYAGLIVLARALEGTPLAARWMDSAPPALASALARQVLEGGAHSEGSLPYERFVLEICLVARLCLDEEHRRKLDGLLVPMARHLRAATLSGRLPFVGDGDDSFFPPFGMRPLEETDPLDPEPVLQLAAHELGDDRLRARDETAEEAFWLGVPGDWKTSARPETRPTRGDPGRQAYMQRETGFVRFEDGAFEGLLLVRDEDEGWIPTHGHNDLLSVLLNHDGRPLLIDPGTGGYVWDRKLRHRLRSTASHSTLQVEGIEQSPISEHRTFEGPATPRCRIVSLRPDRLEVTAASPLGTGDLIHERTLRSDSGLIRIEDRLVARGGASSLRDRRSTVRFLFAPGLQPVQDPNHQSIWGVETPTGTVRFLFLHPKAADWQSLTVPASERYGSKAIVASLVGSHPAYLGHPWVTFVAPPKLGVEELTSLADEKATEEES